MSDTLSRFVAEADAERELVAAVALRARQLACALPPKTDATDRAYRADATNDIVKALAKHDLARVAELALGVEMALIHRRVRRVDVTPAPTSANSAP